jgi:hypothetical protein
MAVSILRRRDAGSGALRDHAPHPSIPRRECALQFRDRPAKGVAQAQGNPRRPAHAGAAVDDDALDVRPLLHEPEDVPGVLGREKDIVCGLGGYDVVEGESQNRDEGTGELGGLGAGVADRDADLHATRPVPLGRLTREHPELNALLHAD